MKSLLILFFCLLITIPIFGQVGLSIGPRATYDLNTFKTDAEDQFGFNAGLVFQVKPSRIFYFETGLNWVQKRFLDPTFPCDPATPGDCPENISGHYDYLQIPLLVRVNMSPFGNYRPYVAAGVAGGRLMVTKSELSFANGETEPFAYDTHPWMFFFFLRAGLDFELTEDLSFFLEAHGSYTSPSEVKDPGSNFVSVGAGVGILFNLNKDQDQKFPSF